MCPVQRANIPLSADPARYTAVMKNVNWHHPQRCGDAGPISSGTDERYSLRMCSFGKLGWNRDLLGMQLDASFRGLNANYSSAGLRQPGGCVWCTLSVWSLHILAKVIASCPIPVNTTHIWMYHACFIHTRCSCTSWIEKLKCQYSKLGHVRVSNLCGFISSNKYEKSFLNALSCSELLPLLWSGLSNSKQELGLLV